MGERFSALRDKLGTSFSGGGVEKLLDEVELTLLQSDVGVEATERIKGVLRDGAARRKDLRGAFRKEIESILSENILDFDEIMKDVAKPVVLLFVGINGSGKTTTIAKIGWRLKKNGYRCVLGSCDTFRAGAVEQLQSHGKKLDMEVIAHQYGSDPASVAYDAVAHAKARGMDCVLLDSAGRMQTNKNLMEEMGKIKRVARPDLTVFVVDSMSGNDALSEAKDFDRSIGIDCIILTKLDSDARGGSAIAIAQELKKPIIFLGNGENYSSLMKFDPGWFVDRIFS